ncbi:MAG TPA: amidase [Gammaproteobacteria bacterium]|nr:amidase [Gammaproteobacteria bacterium]
MTPETIDLCFAGARDLAAAIAAHRVSAVEVMRACLAQIDRLDGRVNAIPTRVPPEQLLAAAEAADRAVARGERVGPLHGLPIAIKDLVLTRGIRTTFGSPLYKDFVPPSDDLHVARCKSAGAIVIGKTNTPEFGAGSQTFNALFGATRNPYDLATTCGGSSGGAAVALACGMVPLADGTDVGGSLRNPASFCNVVGFRPSPGRVARLGARATDRLGVNGPLARSVGDVALLLAAIAGPDPRDASSLAEPGSVFLGSLERDFRGVRLAWSERLGRYPVERAVTSVCNAARGVFAALGCETDDAEPDLDGVDELFQTWRAADYAALHGRTLAKNRRLLKDTVVWNVERGLALTPDDLARADAIKAALDARVERFFERYEFLALPVVQVAPFPLEVEWVREIDGVPLATYVDWMATCYAISCLGLPAIGVPCGFTPRGLPVGLQIVGRSRCDFDVLRLAHAFETATGFGRRRPALVATAAGAAPQP